MIKVREALEHNIADVLENGPGIRYNRKRACAARCPTGKHVLHTGLGAMGVGSMWWHATEAERADPDWESLPVEQCQSFSIGEAEVCK